MVQEEIRKGPWTEHEDVQLVFYVNLFGERRWDFIAKVSGLKRTGKSCRLRWVNYLHPGLKHGKMTPHEERLVLEFQSKWGNRWSRIARKLPGRTDNEIKNYWRTHMRKKAQEIRKTAMSPPSSISNSSSTSVSNSLQVDSIFPITETGNSLDPSSSVSKKSSSSPASKNPPPVDSITDMETDERSFYDTGGVETVAPTGEKEQERERSEKGYSMDDIWREIALSEEGCNLSCQTMDSPIWSYFPELPLTVEEEESKMLVPAITDQFFAGYDQIKSSN